MRIRIDFGPGRRFGRAAWLAAAMRRRRPRRDDGREGVPVEPNRPRQGEGGAAAALEFDGD
jgi:hypothetical protein